MPGKIDPILVAESIIWRPVLEKVVSVTEVKDGTVSLADLCKINALLDMRSDTQEYYTKHPKRKGEDGEWM